MAGETKDLTVTLADGTVLSADMLEGRSGFKESLWHEYEGILRDFGALCDEVASRDAGEARRAVSEAAGHGTAALELVADVYAHEARKEATAR